MKVKTPREKKNVLSADVNCFLKAFCIKQFTAFPTRMKQPMPLKKKENSLLWRPNMNMSRLICDVWFTARTSLCFSGFQLFYGEIYELTVDILAWLLPMDLWALACLSLPKSLEKRLPQGRVVHKSAPFRTVICDIKRCFLKFRSAKTMNVFRKFYLGELSDCLKKWLARTSVVLFKSGSAFQVTVFAKWFWSQIIIKSKILNSKLQMKRERLTRITIATGVERQVPAGSVAYSKEEEQECHFHRPAASSVAVRESPGVPSLKR